jgi:prevent-host-death family protein
MTVRQNPDNLLSEVQYRKGKVIISRDSKPVAALVDIALFERIRKLDEEFDQMRKGVAQAFSDKPQKQVEALVDEAVNDARATSQEVKIVLDTNVLPSGLMAPAG